MLIYCYANGMFSSRRIEAATYRDIAMRYLTANTQPDHSTICAFGQGNTAAIHEAFLHVLRLPQEIARREKLRAKMKEAREQMEARAPEHAEKERAAYEQKVTRREQRKGRAKGRHVKPPDETPDGREPSLLSRRAGTTATIAHRTAQT